MKRLLPLLLLVVPPMVQAQWVEAQKGELVIRGGWLFDSVSDERRRNSGIVIRDGVVHDPAALLRSAEGKIGPVGPDDHAGWELEIRPLRRDPLPLSP